jgi:pyridoxine kinase
MASSPGCRLNRPGGVTASAASNNSSSAMNILSIQSHVAYGHVGNSAAVFSLQRLGCVVWPVHTVQFSNHTGYGAWRGEAFAATMIEAVVSGIADRGVFRCCDGVLSGYLGTVATGEAILSAVAQVKAANPKASYCCDPVIGNRSRGAFVGSGIAKFLRERALPAAEIVTPNHFELDRLAARDTHSRAEVLAAIDLIHAAGPRVVVVTSVQSSETPADALDTIASDRGGRGDGGGRYLVRTPKLDVPANGAGDLFAALFFFHYLRGAALAAALGAAASSVFGLLQRTLAADAPEMLLIEAQDELVAPSTNFTAVPIGL